MGTWKRSFGLGIALWITACSSTRLPVGRDASTMLPDSGIPIPDTGPIIGDPDTRETAADPFANRTFTIRPEYPAPTPDPACTQYGPSDYFQLTFGADTSTVNVLMVSGSAAEIFHATFGPEANKLTYHLTDAFAGGKITFERDQGIEVAQVIVYGSGVPVVRCLRGVLTPQP